MNTLEDAREDIIIEAIREANEQADASGWCVPADDYWFIYLQPAFKRRGIQVKWQRV